MLPPTLVLVPTELEHHGLEELGGLTVPPRRIGFGPVAAAARTAQLLSAERPRRVLLLGLAGTLDAARAPRGSAHSFGRVHLEGVGAGEGSALRSASDLGFAQWEDERRRVVESLPLAGAEQGAGALLTVCAASATPAQARARRAGHPDALAEDMEGFGAALACALHDLPLVIVRGIANEAGERDPARWDVPAALAAARALALRWLERPEWEHLP